MSATKTTRMNAGNSMSRKEGSCPVLDHGCDGECEMRICRVPMCVILGVRCVVRPPFFPQARAGRHRDVSIYPMDGWHYCIKRGIAHIQHSHGPRTWTWTFGTSPSIPASTLQIARLSSLTRCRAFHRTLGHHTFDDLIHTYTYTMLTTDASHGLQQNFSPLKPIQQPCACPSTIQQPCATLVDSGAPSRASEIVW